MKVTIFLTLVCLLCSCSPSLVEEKYTYVGGPEQHTCDGKGYIQTSKRLYVGETEVTIHLHAQTKNNDDDSVYRAGPYQLSILAGGLVGVHTEMVLEELKLQSSFGHFYTVADGEGLPLKRDFVVRPKVQNLKNPDSRRFASFEPAIMLDLDFNKKEHLFLTASLKIYANGDAATNTFKLEFYPYKVSGDLHCSWWGTT